MTRNFTVTVFAIVPALVAAGAAARPRSDASPMGILCLIRAQRTL